MLRTGGLRNSSFHCLSLRGYQLTAAQVRVQRLKTPRLMYKSCTVKLGGLRGLGLFIGLFTSAVAPMSVKAQSISSLWTASRGVFNATASAVGRNEDVIQFHFTRDANAMSWADAIHCLDGERDFRDLVIEALNTPQKGYKGTTYEQPMDAYFWETPPFTSESANIRRFEFVVVNAPYLATITPDPSDFGQHFGPGIRVFPNLGKDAVLLAPSEPKDGNLIPYAHIASFIRLAPEQEKHDLLQTLGKTLQEEVIARQGWKRSKPVWVNTEGSGVFWLHIRLDSRPKYYHHHPYSRADPDENNLSST